MAIANTRIHFHETDDKRTADGKCPVKLCVTFDNQRRYFSLDAHLNKDEWNYIHPNDIAKVATGIVLKKTKDGDVMGWRVTPEGKRGKYRDIAFEYERIKRLADKIIESMPDFTFNQFKNKFCRIVADNDDLMDVMNNYIAKLKSDGRFGYASSFESTVKAMTDFTGGKKMRFVDIDSDWLERFDNHMKTKKRSDNQKKTKKQGDNQKKTEKRDDNDIKIGLSKSTRGIYMRNIRVVFNIATKKHGIIAPYPFTDFKPQTSTGRKLALTVDQLALIVTYECRSESERFYRDLFMFSFMANGMNITDIARLRRSNIIGDEIEFVREKTKNKDTETAIRVPIHPEMYAIMNRNPNLAIGHDAYIFPILKPGMDNEKQYSYIHGFVRNMNRTLVRIAREAGVGKHISTYTARHSWATIAKNTGAAMAYIMEALGHANITTTQRYLAGFDDKARRENTENVVNAVYKKS